MIGQEANDKARFYFLNEEHIWGCAETTFMVLKESFDLPNHCDSSPAMVLNGGIAYSGGVCGAISGAAFAVGILAARRIADHKEAKRCARLLIAALMESFGDAYGSINCWDLIGLDIRDENQHHEFIQSGIWRDRCMRQIEFVIENQFPLRDVQIWEQNILEAEFGIIRD
jgi:C_GCAxxG_C_C family probable redox protein